MTYLRALLPLALLFPLCAHAQDDADTKARLKAAKDLVLLVTPKTVHEQMIQQLMNNMLPALRAQGAKLPKDADKRFAAAIHDVMPYETLVEWAAKIYAKRFTLAELNQLQAFYRTPLGRKLAREQPGISGEVGKIMGELIPKKLPEAMKRHGLM